MPVTRPNIPRANVKIDKTSSLAGKRDKVIEIVKQNGPLLPIIIAKRLELDTTFSSAMLSELVDNKILMLTKVKSGGSPFYYAPGQESKLKDLIKYLNEKDREVAGLLMEKKILRDRDLNTLQRFSLRQMKDFAKGINVTVNNEVDMFWKWYLLSDDEVKKLLNDFLENRFPKPPIKEKSLDKLREEIKKAEAEAKAEEEMQENEAEEEIEDEIEEEKIEIVKPKVKVKTKTKLKEEQKELPQIYKPKIKAEAEIETENETEIDEDPLGMFFVDNNIEIMDQKIIKKNKEINYIAGVNTDVGKGIFFLKYRDKGKINEADLSLALHEAGKIPLIFLSTGELTGKARELLGTEFKGIIFRKI